MHERSVAEDLVKAAGVTTLGEGGTIQAIHIAIGSLSCIDPDALREQVVWYSRGTVAEGASVHVEVTPADVEDAHAGDVRLVAVDVGV